MADATQYPQALSAEMIEKLIHKAWKSENFRQEFISDPTAVIREEYGIELPADLKLHVIEETATDTYLVLPMKPGALVGQELTDEELETVAGGESLAGFGLATGTPSACCRTVGTFECCRGGKSHL